jgi:chitin disaccharide deacetylase
LKGLIITADDFGSAIEVNDAVVAAHREGVLCAASLMVGGAAAADAVARARLLPSLRVGLHVVLIDGRPILPASELSLLVDADGMFRRGMVALGALIAASSKARSQVAAEITAQFEAFLATGLELDHCNAHKHFHLHPVIGRLLTVIGRRHGLCAARAPLEPAGDLRRIDPRISWAPRLLTVPWALLLRRRLRRAGILVPDRVYGLCWSGQMTASRLSALIRNLPKGITEIYLHPATGAFEGGAPGYRYREEFEALMAPEIVALCRDEGLRLGGFKDFEDVRLTQASLA